MALQHQTAWSPDQAAYWVHTQVTTPIQDAAVLKYLELRDTETGILEVGCADGTFVISARRLLRSLTNNHIPIIGVDNCQFMVDRAQQRLDGEASTDPSIAASVSFYNVDLKDLGKPAEAAAMKARFPQGISTIVVMNLLRDAASPDTTRYIRNLTSLLNQGGRVVFTTIPQPMPLTTAVCTQRNPLRATAIINLAPRSFIRAVEREAENHMRGVAGAGPGGAQVILGAPVCTWLGTVLDMFLTPPPGHFAGGVQLNEVATFDPSRRRVCNTSAPRVIYGDSAEEFIHAAAVSLMEGMEGGHLTSANYQKMTQTFSCGNGPMTIQNWLTRRSGGSLAPWQVVSEVIFDKLPLITGGHGVVAPHGLQLVGALMMVSLIRL